MKIEEFRIVARSFNEYIIERKFQSYDLVFKWYNLFWPTKINKTYYSVITKDGYELNIRNHWDVMPTFKNKQDAIMAIKILCSKNTYHYPPFNDIITS